jgi:hypothetical protein
MQTKKMRVQKQEQEQEAEMPEGRGEVYEG